MLCSQIILQSYYVEVTPENLGFSWTKGYFKIKFSLYVINESLFYYQQLSENECLFNLLHTKQCTVIL